MDRTLISELSQKEYLSVKNLIPSKNDDIGARMKLNQQVRELLPKISNDAVIQLYNSGHQLSLIELRKRFSNEMFNDLSELIRLFESLIYGGIANTEIFRATYERALDVSKLSSSLEVAELLRDFGLDIVGDDYPIFEQILHQRNDIQEIIALVKYFNINDNQIDKIIRTIDRSQNVGFMKQF